MKCGVPVSGEQVQEVLKAVSGIAVQSHRGGGDGIMVNVMTIRSQLGAFPESHQTDPSSRLARGLP